MNENLLTRSMAWTCRTIAVCAVALSTTLVSCEYDDAGLNDRIGALEERVSKLEKEMTTQIESLKEMLDGKLTIASCTLNDKGLYTIVLSNGDVITVAKVAKTAPVMGVVAIDGTYYWTLDGEPMFDASGDKVPVAVSPGVRVNSKSNEWEISPDGGKTWLSTGIEATEGSSLFAKVDEDADYVYFTMADGSKLKVAKTTNFDCKVLAGMQYFEAGETRTVKLDLSDVKKSTVTKPDGWKAVIESGNLKITAPAAENTYAEQGGKVAIVAVASNGQSMISEVTVKIGTQPNTITIDELLNVSITIDPTLSASPSYKGYFYGATTFDTFSPEKIIEDLKANSRLQPITTATNKTLAEILGSEPDKGTYVVYVVDYQKGVIDAPENILFTTVTKMYTEFEVKDITHDDAQLSVNVIGASQCWAGIVKTADYAPGTILSDIADGYVSSPVSAQYSGLISKYSDGIKMAPDTKYTIWVVPIIPGKAKNSYTAQNFFTKELSSLPISYNGTATVEMADVVSTMSEVSTVITPGNGVYKFYSQYLKEAQFAGKTDEELILSLINSRRAVTIPPATYTLKQTGLQPGDKGYFISVGVDKNGQAGRLVRKEAITTPITFSKETISGEITTTPMSASIKMSGNTIKSYNYVVMQQSKWNSAFQYGPSLEQIEKMIAVAVPGNSYSIKLQDAAQDGTLTLDFTNLIINEPYYLFIVGIDKDGAPTKMVRLEYTPAIEASKYIAATDAAWTANYADAPKLSNIKSAGTLLSDLTAIARGALTANVTVGPKCAEYWIFANSKSYVTATGAKNTTIATINKVNENPGSYGGKGTTNQVDLKLNGYFTSGVIYIVWKDTDGNFYQHEEFDWQALLKK